MSESASAAPPSGRKKRMSRTGKTVAGLGLAIGLLFCSVVIAGLRTHAARSASDDLKSRHLPLMEAALAMEEHVYEAVFHVSMFGISGDMASYSEARIRFATIRETAGRFSRLASGSPEGPALSREMEKLAELAHKLNLIVEKKRTLNDNLLAEQAGLEKTAGDIGDILLDLQARTASATSVKGNEMALDEKARLLVLNGFSLAVAETTGRVLAAGVAKSAADLVKAQTSFAERWAEARDACTAAAGLPASGGLSAGRLHAEDPAGSMGTLVAAYAKALGAIRYNLEESARVAAEGIEVTGRLTALARGIVSLVRAGMAAAAGKTDAALRDATFILFGCALLACLLAVTSAVVFMRSRAG